MRCIDLLQSYNIVEDSVDDNTLCIICMSNDIKLKIYQLLDDINDDNILNQVMEDVVFYTSKKDIIDTLSPEQMDELDIALKEANDNQTIPWADFKKEMNEWRKK